MIKLETLRTRKVFNLGKGGIQKQLQLLKTTRLIYNTNCPTCSDDIQARKARNPKTGEEVVVPARKKAFFKVSKELNKMLK